MYKSVNRLSYVKGFTNNKVPIYLVSTKQTWCNFQGCLSPDGTGRPTYPLFCLFSGLGFHKCIDIQLVSFRSPVDERYSLLFYLIHQRFRSLLCSIIRMISGFRRMNYTRDPCRNVDRDPCRNVDPPTVVGARYEGKTFDRSRST